MPSPSQIWSVQDVPRAGMLLILCIMLAGPVMAQEGRQAQGVLRGAEEALLSSEMPGRIVGIAEEGATFSKGDTLVQFACDGQKAEEDAARATERQARAKVDNQRRLEATQSAGRLDVELAEAQQAESRARIRVAEARSSLCRVLAPYDGLVLKRSARLYESVGLMAPLIQIARRGPPEVTIIVPAAWLASLRMDMPFTFVSAATAEKSGGHVSHFSGSVDPSSQTLEIRGVLTSEIGGGLRSGMAGAVLFSAPATTQP